MGCLLRNAKVFEAKEEKKEACEMENSEVLREDIRRKSQKWKVESGKWKVES